MSLRLENLVQGYGKKTVLNDISFEVPEGKMVAVLGPNGCGKSTLIKTVCKIIPPKGGRIIAEGEDISDIDRREFSKIIGYVPQKYAPSDYMQVFDAILIGRAPYMGWSYSDEDFEAAADAVDEMGIADLIDKDIQDLSGGQIQKVIIARAIAQKPRYFILDEPTSALDLRNQLNTLRTMKRIIDKQNAGVLVALHDLNLAMKFADHVVMLKDGKVFAAGAPEEVINEDSIMAVYNVSSEIVEGRGGKYVHICEDEQEDYDLAE
ncbi:MAG: ABC transporter ATP-binding protein [archaeon]|nr:ABC transporter ATP-binding protein [archaeon]